MKLEVGDRVYHQNHGYGLVRGVSVEAERNAPVLRCPEHIVGVELPDRPGETEAIPADELTRCASRIRGRFFKQAWNDNDYAVPLGEVGFEATDHIMEMDWDEFRDIEDNDSSSDEIGLAHVLHEGPHEVQIVEGIAQYLGFAEEADVASGPATASTVQELVEMGLTEKGFHQAKALHAMVKSAEAAREPVNAHTRRDDVNQTLIRLARLDPFHRNPSELADVLREFADSIDPRPEETDAPGP